MARVFLGLGSNIGERTANLRRATEIMARKADATLVSFSSVYASAALLKPGSPASWNIEYRNAVVIIDTELPPLALLRVAKKTETLIGRQARGEWAPREIDIDLLTYEGAEIATPELTLPHPLILQRDFVVLPMAEIAPDAFVPGLIPLTPLRRYAAEKFSGSGAVALHPLFA